MVTLHRHHREKMEPRRYCSSLCNKLTVALLLCAVAAAKVTPGVSNQLDCSMRRLMYKRANAIQPWRAPHRAVFDSLELASQCGETPPESTTFQPQPEAPTVPSTEPSVFVDAVRGDDHHLGTEVQPVRTVAAAIDICRQPGGPRRVVLRAGNHFLNQTLRLGPSDSGLTVTAYPGELPWLSGGNHVP